MSGLSGGVMKNLADNAVAFQAFDQHCILVTMPIKHANLGPRPQSEHACEVGRFIIP